MLNLLKALRHDENGVILSAEIVIVGSLLVIGMITGLTCLQQSVNGELKDVANAIGSLDQSYSFSAHRKPGANGQCCAYTAGSSYLNCERKPDCSSDIVGITGDCCGKQAVAVGCCGEGRTGCGSATGCGGCGNTGCGGCTTGAGTTGARCIESGVPKMKITEWPSTSVPVHPAVEQNLIPLPAGGIHGLPCPVPACPPAHSNDLNIPSHVF